MFQIYRTDPIHCGITDGIIGSRITALPMLYRSERLARKLASRLSQAENENCGDGAFYARPAGFPYGECPETYLHRWTGPADPEVEIPF